MMSLKDLELNMTYNTITKNVIRDFYNPCLSHCKKYQRITAYFSSAILVQLTYGLANLIKNGGTMQLIISHQLDMDEYNAIKNGYDLQSVLNESFMKAFDENDLIEQKDRFGLLSYLIMNKYLDIKIGFIFDNRTNEFKTNSLLHTKTGVFIDEFDNKVSFIGSVNETYNGYNNNYETFDVHCSWLGDDSKKRCDDKQNMFENLWKNEDEGVEVIDFPNIIKKKIFTAYDENKVNNYLEIDNNSISDYIKTKVNNFENKINILNESNLYDYQKQAISNWKNNNYNGIFDMATGTGKTFTACGSIKRLEKHVKRFITVICCPRTNLVDQWIKETKLFGIKALACYDNYSSYKEQLKRNLTAFKRGSIDQFCMIITNSSFLNSEIQAMLKEQKENIYLIVDEAHNFGASNISKTLETNYKYRLALSATIYRHYDETGTSLLFKYFDKIVFEYSLDQAIADGKLTSYNYYPVIVYLDEDEYSEYEKITLMIRKSLAKDSKLTDVAKMLLIRRARIIAAAKDKINKLVEIIEEKEYQNDTNMLIYCGAVSYDTDVKEDENERQVDRVIKTLKNKFDMNTTRFTSRESNETRANILNIFENQKTQALVAIQCLDEGINIPAIKRAFILASSTNEKEYIQRKGRLLRLHEGKKVAEIYDFITLPRRLDKVKHISEEIKKIDYSLLRREVERMENFSNSSLNNSNSYKLRLEIEDAYNVNLTEEVIKYE